MYNEKIINKIKDILVEKEQTIAVAESVTSGHLQAAISLAMDASHFYQGGITAYNIGQKVRHLNIEPIHAQKVNCVSENIACDMALNVSELFKSNYGIGITGYATIVPECEKEGLFAYTAISFNNEIVITKRITSIKNTTLDVQLDYTCHVLNMLAEYFGVYKIVV